MLELDKIIHQPVRTKIMAYLSSAKECDYTTLRNSLELSDGHMSTHMKELVGCEYVEMEKSFVDNKPKTTYRITNKGRKAFATYVTVLKEIISTT
ncbi:MAG TPA: transcriptional regulator [Bdellovibrionales bacterium]|nr:transcriptional regulator [Bdellovibrionales bacterium]